MYLDKLEPGDIPYRGLVSGIFVFYVNADVCTKNVIDKLKKQP